MMLTPQHRRSSRLAAKAKVEAPKKADKQVVVQEYDLSLQCDEEFAPDYNQQLDCRETDEYEELPHFEGYEYDKEYYMASSSYSSFVDEEIRQLQQQSKKSDNP